MQNRGKAKQHNGMQCKLKQYETFTLTCPEAVTCNTIFLLLLAGMTTNIDPEDDDLQLLLLVSIGVVCACILGGMVWIMIVKLVPRPKEFDVFISHHKTAAGALARELNLLLSVYCKRKVAPIQSARFSKLKKSPLHPAPRPFLFPFLFYQCFITIKCLFSTT